ncbi:MAG TPA: hypothetical protein VGK64_05025 [Bryobacteraceae bacterium]
MGSANGGFREIPRTGNPMVDAALQRMQERNDSRFRDIEDAMVVQAHLEKKMSEVLRRHAELLASQDESLERHKLRMEEFDDKLNALIDIIMRRESGSAPG